MKVLFEVQDEQVSTNIVKTYQKKYKEIISYKNVYYFTAILKELQRDKTYDRIVIDEELEEMNSTSYKQKDTFIFERLDNISDEAENANGKDIPIILICSERRTKSEEIFVKLFGLGIYNAIIGNDRSTEEVCRLIKQPRTKKQAKIYYKIYTDEVSYKPENENDVSEEEMQNILMHFKKLGKDEEKYVSSFSRIVKQYNDEQLKIITKILPVNVKSVLEEKSPEYQRLVSINGTMKTGTESQKEKAGTVERLLKTTDEKSKLTRPVVVPSIMKKDNVRKLSVRKPTTFITQEEDDDDLDLSDIEIPEMDDNDAPVSETDMTRYDMQEVNEFDEVKNEESDKPRKRGRPRKYPVTTEIEKPKQPRKRGRPRKNPIPEEVENVEEDDLELGDINDIEEINSQPKQNYQKSNQVDRPEFDDDEITELTMFDEDEEDDELETLPGFDDEEDDDENSNVSQFNNKQNKNQETDEDTLQLPGLDDEYEYEEEYDDSNELPGFEDEDSDNDSNELPGFEDEDSDDDSINQLPGFEDESNYNSEYEKYKMSSEDRPRIKENERIEPIESNKYDYDNSNFENLLSSDKKIVAFVGTSKNGTSFLVNNIAQYLSLNGIDTAILDTTQNKNSYYIYTKNEEDLRSLAADSVSGLLNGRTDGIRVNNNLTVYTSVPNQEVGLENVVPILETLVKNHSAILIDCDFATPYEYFEKAQEIYLVQSMDVLTIQPLTAFLRELKAKDIIDQNKIRIILNKVMNLSGVTSKNIIGGMAFYNDPEMSFMTELFDRTTVKYLEIPFDEEVYAQYLEGIVECEITINKYPKNFQPKLKELAEMVYPLLPNNRDKKQSKNRGYEYSTGFSSSVNNTLNNMKRRY